jgi:hypothetical protein
MMAALVVVVVEEMVEDGGVPGLSRGEAGYR